jgi:hypothetical protein
MTNNVVLFPTHIAPRQKVEKLVQSGYLPPARAMTRERLKCAEPAPANRVIWKAGPPITSPGRRLENTP